MACATILIQAKRGQHLYIYNLFITVLGKLLRTKSMAFCRMSFHSPIQRLFSEAAYLCTCTVYVIAVDSLLLSANTRPIPHERISTVKWGVKRKCFYKLYARSCPPYPKTKSCFSKWTQGRTFIAFYHSISVSLLLCFWTNYIIVRQTTMQF